jgi:hypothetical protein
MVLGIVLSAFNGVYFKKPNNTWFEFLPQLCFMLVHPMLHCLLVLHVVSR